MKPKSSGSRLPLAAREETLRFPFDGTHCNAAPVNPLLLVVSDNCRIPTGELAQHLGEQLRAEFIDSAAVVILSAAASNGKYPSH